MRSKVDVRWVTLIALLALLVAIPAGVLSSTSTTFVKGSVTTNDPQTLSPDAIAVVTIVDRSARGGSGVIIGQKRIANPGATPFTFSVRYDPGRIVPDHAYVVFVAVIDGTKRWQNADGVPVITGGPTTGVDVRVKKLPGTPVATIAGEIIKKDKTALGGSAVAIAAVLDLDTGRTVAWTAITPSGDTPIAFELGFDPAITDPGANLVAWAAIVDKLSVWESPTTTPLIAAGPNLSAGSISVSPATELPSAPEPTPTPAPTPTPTPVTIPSVRNQPETKAVDTLEAADLTVAETQRKYNSGIAKGDAVKTNPEAGTRVPPGSDVTLVVSKGPSPSPSPTATPKPTAKPNPTAKPTPTPTPTARPTPTATPVAVPDVRGMTEADAVIELSDADLKVGDRNQRANTTVPVGSIIKTAPAQDTRVQPGSRVDLFVSTGPEPTPTPEPVAVPDVSGLPEADAILALTDVKLEIGSRFREHDEDVPAGAVMLTDPDAGSRVPPGTFVDLVVSDGPDATPTPAPTATPQPSRTPLPTPAPTLAPWPYPTQGVGILSGALIYRDTTVASPQRHVVLTLLEESTFGTRVLPIEQYVDEGAAPLGFVITFDWSQIDPLAHYRVLAAIVDGENSWYTGGGAAAITGRAPISGLLVPLFQRGDILEGQVTGVIVGVDVDLSAAATREAFLVRGDTGAVVAYDAGPVGETSRVQVFNIPFLLEAIDENVPYLVVGRVIDGPWVWTGPGVPVVTLGAPFRVVVPVSPLTGPSQPLDAPGS